MATKVTEIDGYRITTREIFERGEKRVIHEVVQIEQPAAAPAAVEAKATELALPKRRGRE